MGGVLIVFPFPKSIELPEVLQYKLEAYCNTNWSCIAIRFREVVVGVSDILLRVCRDFYRGPICSGSGEFLPTPESSGAGAILVVVFNNSMHSFNDELP